MRSRLSRRTLLAGAGAVGATGLAGGGFVATSSVEAELLAHLKKALPGVRIDEASALRCIADNIGEWSPSRLKALAAIWRIFGVEGSERINSRFGTLPKRIITRFVTNSNFFDVADPRTALITYERVPPEAGCAANRFATYPVLAASDEAPAASRPRGPHEGPATRLAAGPLQVAPDGRRLIHRDGTPFFYLADTNWELLRRARREDAERLIEKRRAQGFTVITAPVTGIIDAIDNKPLEQPNVYGRHGFTGRDVLAPIVTPGQSPTDPAQYDYWDHIGHIIDIAARKGLFVALLPGWHHHYTAGVINPDNARAYGRFLGKRFGDRENIIWVLGGDTHPDHPRNASTIGKITRRLGDAIGWQDESRNIGTRLFHELAAGLREGETLRHLMTFHPTTNGGSSKWFHAAPWLDFNMIQSGHDRRDVPNYKDIAADVARMPPKPAIDGESRYEDHAVRHDTAQGWFEAFDCRQAAYWGVFAGAMGHVYGCRGVWQMFEPGRAKHRPLRYYWYDAMDLPGAWQMLHLRRLMQSRPVAGRMPDQALVESPLEGAAHIRATRGDGFAMAYTPAGEPIAVDLARLGAAEVIAWWYDPRTGAAQRIGTSDGRQRRVTFAPPGARERGNDWVLVIDDKARGFPPPGDSGITL